MRKPSPLLFACAFLICSGCFHATGNIIESTERLTTPMETSREEVQIPDSEKVTFDFKSSEEGVAVTVWRRFMCADEVTTVKKNTEVIERRLPGGYYGLLVTSLLVTGGGIGMWAGGASLVEQGDPTTVGGPAEEKKMDQGKILVPIGVATTALGALFLTFDAIDLGYARDDVYELPISRHTTLENERRCALEPFSAAQVEIFKNVLLGSNSSLSLETDGDGNAVFAADSIRREFCPDEAKDTYMAKVGDLTGDVTKIVRPLCDESNAARETALVESDLDTVERFIKEGELRYAAVYLGKVESARRNEDQEVRYTALKKKYEELLPAWEKKEARRKAKEEREEAREAREEKRRDAAEARRQKLEERALVEISNIQPRIGLGNHVFMEYDATAKKRSGRMWIPVRARCKDGSKIRVGESFGDFHDMNEGETSAVRAAFSKIEIQYDLSWCEFEFSTSNSFFRRGKSFKKVCWRGSSVYDGSCD